MYLEPKNGEIIFDGTMGDGGHAKELIQRILPNGRYIGVDIDPEAVSRLKKKFEHFSQVQIFHSNYIYVNELLEKIGISEVNIAFLDLGVCSIQINTSYRGFSFQIDGPLDMRMNLSSGTTAEEIINSYSVEKLAEIFSKYGEVKNAKQIAKAICKYRKKRKFTSTLQLANFLEELHPSGKRIHPATKIFQALRIYINNELDNLSTFLERIPQKISINGRIGIITFHSLEDRIVKKYFSTLVEQGDYTYVCSPFVKPTKEELLNNISARSAKLRIIRRIK